MEEVIIRPATLNKPLRRASVLCNGSSLFSFPSNRRTGDRSDTNSFNNREKYSLLGPPPSIPGSFSNVTLIGWSKLKFAALNMQILSVKRSSRLTEILFLVKLFGANTFKIELRSGKILSTSLMSENSEMDKIKFMQSLIQWVF
jgi:hypothetical protein